MKKQPIYETTPSSYLSEQVLRILLDPNIDPRKVCHGIPIDVTNSSTLDLTSLNILMISRTFWCVVL